MLTLRKADEIYRSEGGWYDARWHFSFDHYHDPEQMGIGPLRVFNDDRLVPGGIWPMHPHADVEGITYVVEGSFRHQDNVGGGGELEAGAVQRMTLGSGARHSEQNASQDEPMRFLQFWILPDAPGLPPGVEQRQFSRDDFRGRWVTVLRPGGGEGTLHVHQDATAALTLLSEGQSAAFSTVEGRGAYLYLIDGLGRIDGETLHAGDAVKVQGPETVVLEGVVEAHAIVIDVPLAYQPVGVWARR